MRRTRRAEAGPVWVFLSVVAVPLFGAPNVAAAQFVEVGCTSILKPAEGGSCEVLYSVPHFDGQDYVESYAARIIGVAATDWLVEGHVWDATGTHYLSWSCKAMASTALGNGVSHGCSISRPNFTNALGEVYKADVSGPQRMVVTAQADECLEPVDGCQFEGSLVLGLHD